MGGLADSRRCRLCGKAEGEKIPLLSLLEEKIVLRIGEPDNAHQNHLTVDMVELIAQHLSLDLRLDKFPRMVCGGCRDDFQTLVDFCRRINEGQQLLHSLLGMESKPEEVHLVSISSSETDPTVFFTSQPAKKRGRPRKGCEKRPRDRLELALPLFSSKRIRRSPKKLDAYVSVDVSRSSPALPPATPPNSKRDSSCFPGESLELRALDGLQIGDQDPEFTLRIHIEPAGMVNPPGTVGDNQFSVLMAALGGGSSILGDTSHSTERQLTEQQPYKCDKDSGQLLLQVSDSLASPSADATSPGLTFPSPEQPKSATKQTLAKKTRERKPFNGDSGAIGNDAAGKPKFPCDKCERAFNAPTSLKYHQDVEHGTVRFACTIEGCDKSFPVKNLLTRHLRNHGGERPHKCPTCAKSFKTLSNLYTHQNAHAPEARCACHECGQTFKYRSSLNAHLRAHRGERKFACSHCSKAFHQKGNMLEHMRVHTGERPYLCQLCPRAFSTSSQLKVHRMRHNGVRPHACYICSKRFVDTENLRVHMRRHEGVRPFVCKLCCKAFVDQWSLTKHQRSHAGGQPGVVTAVVTCSLCDKTYSDPSNLSRHMRTHHRDKRTNDEIVLVSKDNEGEEEGKHTIWTIMRDLSDKLPHQVTEVAEEGDEEEELEQVIYVTYEDEGESGVSAATAVTVATTPTPEDQTSLDLTAKDGHPMRMVAPLSMDPLSFAAEYLKDLQLLSNPATG